MELRSFPEGQVLSVLHRADDRVAACAFSPDDHSLAFAGDAFQTIRVQDLRDPKPPPIQLRGHGASIRDVGFHPNGEALGFSRRPFGPDNPRYEGFDLKNRRVTPFAAADLDRAVETLDGWTIRPTSPFQLEATDAQGLRLTLALDQERDGRWWCYSLLRPRMAGRRPLVAIGCTQGVSIHSLDDEGRRTRLLAGHAGPVTALAASRDGKWLVTGSTDQTLRLWTLAGAEAVPDLGATFRRAPDGDQVVVVVRKRSFADDMDLREGDILGMCGFGSSQVDPDALVARVDAITPDIPISIQVRNRRNDQGKGPFQTVTTKRQSPALTLFASSDPAGEWVLWMPQGYYDTSIEGDGKYLGWHLNQSWLDQPKPTLHFPIKQYQGKLHRKDIIDKLLVTADLDAALAALVPPDQPKPPDVVKQEQPPTPAVKVTETDGRRATIHVHVESARTKISRRPRSELIRISSGSSPTRR